MQKIVTKYGFSTGDKVMNADRSSANFLKKATVIGFHLLAPAVFVKYSDGSYGSDNRGENYIRLSDIKE